MGNAQGLKPSKRLKRFIINKKSKKIQKKQILICNSKKNRIFARILRNTLRETKILATTKSIAGMAKLVAVPDLGSGAERHGGSSPSTRTYYQATMRLF